MAVEKIGVEVEVKTGKAQSELTKVTNGIKQFNEELDRNYDGVKAIDAVTGDAASTYLNFKDQLLGGIKAVGGLTKSFKGLKAAMLASGIGAIVVAVAAIAANWEKIQEAVSGVTGEQKKLLKDQERAAELSKQNFERTSETENILKLQGKTEREILELKMKQTDETIAALEAQLATQKDIQKIQVETAQKNRAILDGLILMVTLPIQALLEGIDQVASLFGMESNLREGFADFLGDLIIDPEKIEKEGNEGIAETEKQLTKLKNMRAGYQLQINKEDKAAADQRLKDQEEAYQKELDALQKRLQKEIDLRREGTRKVGEIRSSFFEKNLGDSEAAQQILLERERQRYIDEINQSSALQAQKNMALAEVNKFYDDKSQALKDESAAEDEARENALQQQKMQIVGDTFGALSQILGENSKAGKSAAIAQATINTFQGMTEVFANKTTIPEPFGTIAKFASAAGILASGMATVKQITAVKKPEGVKGGGGGGATVAAPAVAAPAFNIVGATGTNQIAEAIAETTKKPQRAYVVAGDVSTAQELDRKTIEGASLG